MNRSCDRTLAEPTSLISVGIVLISLGMSDRESDGMVDRASGESAVSCRFFNSEVRRTISSTCITSRKNVSFIVLISETFLKDIK